MEVRLGVKKELFPRVTCTCSEPDAMRCEPIVVMSWLSISIEGSDEPINHRVEQWKSHSNC